MNPNFLFLNQGDGTFEDATEISGAAFDVKGQAQSGMGVDAEDVDGDGRPELFVTNFDDEYNTLYQNLGNGQFQDLTPFSAWPPTACPGSAGAAPWPTSTTTAGPTASSPTATSTTTSAGGQPRYAEPPLLHRNVPAGDGRRFRLATRDVGPYFDAAHVGRGAAFGDLDDDGDLDIVVNHKDGPPAVLRNDTPTRQPLDPPRAWSAPGATATPSAPASRSRRGGRTIHRQRKGGVQHRVGERPPAPDRRRARRPRSTG